MRRAALLALVLALPQLAAAQEPTPTPTLAPTPTLLPTPAPLSAAGEMLPAMGAVMGRASALSTQQIGMFILAVGLLVIVFELLRVFLVRRFGR